MIVRTAATPAPILALLTTRFGLEYDRNIALAAREVAQANLLAIARRRKPVGDFWRRNALERVLRCRRAVRKTEAELNQFREMSR